MTNPPPTLVLVHGWGFDADFWNPLRAALAEFPSFTIELGFCGAEIWHGQLPKGPLVAIGHSLGFLWLLHERPFNWQTLIGINAFPRFTEGDGFAPALPMATLRLMMTRLQRSPQKTLADFLALCGSNKKPDVINTERLHLGLEWMMNRDERATLENEPSRVMALAGRTDTIVAETMSAAAFNHCANVDLHWHDGGHLLPLTDVAWCAEKIRERLGR